MPGFRSWMTVTCAALATLAGASAATAAETREDAGPPATAPERYAQDSVIVVFERGADGRERAQTRAAADVAMQRTLGRTDFQLVRVEDGQTVTGALRELRADPDVRVASRDGFDSLAAVPNDPQYGSLWGLRNPGIAPGIQGFPNPLAGADIDAEAAWDRTKGVPSAVLADIDSGYRFNHEDLAPVTWSNDDPPGGGDDDGNGFVDDSRGWDFVGPNNDITGYAGDNDPTDDDMVSGGHGVHVAGTMAARGDNGQGISGVSQNARIMPLRVCSPSPTFQQVNCRQSAQIAAINYAGANGARAANLSLGGTGFNQAVVTAFASNPQTLYVVAAGNDGRDNDAVHQYPCDYNPATDAAPAVPGAVDNIVCVAATDQADGLAGFSNYSDNSVDLGAPGASIRSTYPRVSQFHEDFEGGGFSAWTSDGGVGGFARASESPLTSFGITDTPGTGPTTGTRRSTSPPVAIPADVENCVLTHTRNIAPGGTYKYEILKNGAPIFELSPTTSGRFFAPAQSGLGGSNVQFRVSYTAGAGAPSTAGAWVDDVDLDCFLGTSATGGYGFLDGTSMATPHVTGAAGLLFSLRPSATVTQVRTALLSSVDPIASLAGKTVTGGRLNAAAALDALAPPEGAPGRAPAGAPGGATGASGFSGAGRLVAFSLAGMPGSLQLSASGTGALTVNGTPGTAGTLSLSTAKPVASAKKKKPKKKVLALAKKAFTVPASGKAKVTFKVSGKGLKTLKKAKRLSVRVTVTGSGRTVSKAVTLKAPKAKKKRSKRKS